MNFDPKQMSREQLQALADRMPFSGHAFQGLLDGIRPPQKTVSAVWLVTPCKENAAVCGFRRKI